jgi:putative ABC transport system substrate-binding protein
MSRIFLGKALAGVLLATAGTVQFAHAQTVAVTQFVEHPELDKVRKGALDALKEAGYASANVVFESAQADIATASQIASRFNGLNPAVIIAIATPSAQMVVNTGTSVPVVFGAVSDPVAAGLVKDLDHPGGNVTGTSARPDVGPQLDQIKQLTPGVKRIGVLFNPAEVNSKVLVEDFVKQGAARGFDVRTEAVTSSAEVLSATANLVDRVDAIYVPTDSTVVSGLEAAAGLAIEKKLPLYTADTNGVNRGALAAIGYDYYEVGRDTGAIAARILGGEKPGDIAVVPAKKSSQLFNAKTAKAIGIIIPKDLLDQASAVIE